MDENAYFPDFLRCSETIFFMLDSFWKRCSWKKRTDILNFGLVSCFWSYFSSAIFYYCSIFNWVYYNRRWHRTSSWETQEPLYVWLKQTPTTLVIDFILIEVQLPIHRKGVLVYKSLIDHFMEFPSKRSILSKTQW